MSGRGSVALTPMHTAHIFICFLRWSLPLPGWDELDFIWTNQFVLIDTVQVFHFTECQTICLRRSGTKVVWVRVNFYFRTLVVTPKQYWNYDLSNILIYQDYYRSSSHSQGCQILSFGRYSLFGWSVWFWDLKYSLRILWHPPGVQTWTAYQVRKRARVNISKTKPGFSGRTRSLQAEVSPGKQPRYAIAVASDTLH